MEYIRTADGKDIKVVLPIGDYKKLQKKIELFEELEKLNISPEDLIDLLLVRQTRNEKSVSLEDYFKE